MVVGEMALLDPAPWLAVLTRRLHQRVHALIDHDSPAIADVRTPD